MEDLIIFHPYGVFAFFLQAAGLFKDKIIACATRMAEKNKDGGEITYRDVVATHDNCNRASTTLEGLAKAGAGQGAGNFITAGNASQLSDGSSTCVLMETRQANAWARLRDAQAVIRCAFNPPSPTNKAVITHGFYNKHNPL